MADRQYGIPTGHHQGPSYRSQDHTAQIDSFNSAESHQLGDYPSSGRPSASRSPPRAPVAPYARKPVAATPGYAANQGHDSAPPMHQQQNSTHPEQNDYSRAAAGGGLAGASSNNQNYRPYESGHQASRNPENLYTTPGAARDPQYAAYASQTPSQMRPAHQHMDSQNSQNPFGSRAELSHRSSSPHHSERSGAPAAGMAGYGYGYDQPMPRSKPYRGDGYDDAFDPRNIADDGDTSHDFPPNQRRSHFGRGTAAGAGAGAAAGGAGMMNAFGSRDPSGNYGPVPGGGNAGTEKSEWSQRQDDGEGGRRRRKIILWIAGIVVLLAIIGGVIGGLFAGGIFGSGGSSDFTPASDGLYDLESDQVKELMNNDNLHRVFPGVDYTPLNAQYPDCLSYPLDQNNITLDVAVLSQLTPAIRLYGTDCKQTEMVLKGIDILGMTDSMKVWLGVWLDTNTTTNARQVKQMHSILDNYPASRFAGVIIGNEVLYREDLTITQLANQMTQVRNELDSRGVDLPVATSDLGDDWTSGLAAQSDIVMSNVHPFFAGVKPEAATSWTWTFWQEHDVILKTQSGGAWPANLISETGWPSEGGNSCGTPTGCTTKTQGSIAGIDEMNTFMDGWVCPALANGTSYFWFVAFDEPWKERFDDPSIGNFWEPHWGLMDVDRKLKDGLKIPDCGGKTMDNAY